MVRTSRPFVPQPQGTPFPDKHHSTEERARILNVYLRPWVLSQADVCAHVPHLTDLNSVRIWTLPMSGPKRRRCKSAPLEIDRCSHRAAWKEYVRGHIVSEHAKRIILHFLVGNCCYSMKEHYNDEPGNEKAAREKLPAVSMSLHTLHQHMQSMTEIASLPASTSAQAVARKDVHSGCALADTLWIVGVLMGTFS